MGLILGIIVIVVGVSIAGLILFADGMSDSPSTQISPIPPALFGLVVGGALILSHFAHFHMAW
jgi:hypothetical protein